MERNERLYPISPEQFRELVLPIIEASYRGKGRPPKVSHYHAFCGMLYVLRTGCSWRDLPQEYGYWHVVYDRFNHGRERGIWARILLELQNKAGICFREVRIDRITMKVQRQGGGQKGGAAQRNTPRRDEQEVSSGAKPRRRRPLA
ncbi:MAG: transposase [Treponema sp.]|jgi:transposase|nr:transposase [Treponema sp.]